MSRYLTLDAGGSGCRLALFEANAGSSVSLLDERVNASDPGALGNVVGLLRRVVERLDPRLDAVVCAAWRVRGV